jgi:hypothetical protein
MIDDSKYNLPGINWLVHVLTNNVGHNEWVQMNPQEQAEFTAKTGSDYNNKVISHPIPVVEKIIDLNQGKYVAAFSDDYTKQLYLQLAHRYKEMEAEYYRIAHELKAEHWVDASKECPCRMSNPPGSRLQGNACSAAVHSCLITSPALRYVVGKGVAKGFYRCNLGGTKDGDGFL